jgi:hypothetical protein
MHPLWRGREAGLQDSHASALCRFTIPSALAMESGFALAMEPADWDSA